MIQKNNRSRPPVVATVISLLAVAAATVSLRANFTASDFLKTSGIYVRNSSGTGSIVDLHGTNLGGWLTQENWMSPQGVFALDRTGWAASASVTGSGYSAASAVDGDGTTVWTTGANQANGQWFQLDMQRPQSFNEVDLDVASFTTDYPVGYQVLVSNDATNWTDVATGSGSSPVTSIVFTPQVARYVRVVQTGTGSHWWTIAEINVSVSWPCYARGGWTATASSTGSGTTPNNALDGNENTHWTSGASQAGGEWFQVDMGVSQSVSDLIVDSGPSTTGDYPRGWSVLVSNDATNWTTAIQGVIGTSRIIHMSFGGQTCRYFRIVQTGSSTNWWSIAEVYVYGNGAVDRTGWSATASVSDPSSPPSNVFDYNAGTRWSTGVAQSNGQWFQVDMQSNHTFNQIVLDSGTSSTGDYPNAYKVEVSNDAATWTQVATGNGFNEQLPINFPAVSARYLKITQTGSSGSWWSIGELNLYLNMDENDMRNTLNARFSSATVTSLMNGFQTTWLTTSDLDNMKAMGMNFLRAPIHWEDILMPDGVTLRSDAFTELDWLVNACSSRNIYVLLDYHVAPGGVNPWGSGGQIGPMPNGFWTNTANQDISNTVWQKIAAHYVGNPAVAGYEVLNEGVIAFSESSAQAAQKNAIFNRFYSTIRGIDPDHMVFFDAFFNFGMVDQPSVYGWTNCVYEMHPYDMPDHFNWYSQLSSMNNTINDAVTHQNDPTNWGVPLYMGEYCWYYFTDLWQYWMSSLNARHIAWTNWTYKVTGPQSDGSSGYWGLYNSNGKTVPVMNADTSSTIASKWSNFGTSNFSANTPLINAVTPLAAGQPFIVATPLSYTGMSATASSSGNGTSPGNALAWNVSNGSSSTRWTSGAPQASGQWYQVNLGSKQSIEEVGIETATGGTASAPFDYPVGYQVQVSNDATTWSTVASGPGFGPKMIIPFPPQYAQYVKVVQTGASTNWWSMAQFTAFGELALSRTGWVATASSTEPGGSTANALDGNLSTRWSSGAAQANGQWYEVDMLQNQTFNRVVMDSGSNTSDYARGYQVEVSTDNSTWTTVASGTASSSPILVTFAPQYARYLKIVQTGTASSWWSISELNVYGEQEYARTGWSASASSTEGGGSATNAIDGNYATRWSSGAAQTNGQWFQVDLGSSQWFNHLIMDSGSNTNDYARGYIVQISNDGVNWSEIAVGQGTGPVETVNFPNTQGRYIKVIQTGSASSWWSIVEFRVFQ